MSDPAVFLQMCIQLSAGPRIQTGLVKDPGCDTEAFVTVAHLVDAGFADTPVSIERFFDAMDDIPRHKVRESVNKAVDRGLVRKFKVGNRYEYRRAVFCRREAT